jgi:hypothetical protein
MRKILPYLLLNFLVSALAVVIVLLVWDKFHQPGSSKYWEGSYTANSNAATSLDSGELPPLDMATVEIQGIIGAGDLDTERVTLFNVSDLQVNLNGWKLSDANHNDILLPPITIYPGGGVVVYSKSGVNSAVEVYSNLEDAIFSSGEKVRLLDSQGHLRSNYVVP